MGKITHKEIRRELNEDAVMETGRKAWEFVRGHQNAILIALIAVAVVWAASGLVRARRQSVLAGANLRITQAEYHFLEAVNAGDAGAREQGLAKANQELAAVVGGFAGSPVALRARYLSGCFNFRAMKFDQAVEQFQAFEREASTDADRARGAVAVGYCLENAAFVSSDDARLAKALEAYERAIAVGGSSYVKYQAMLAKARLLSRDPGKRAEAIELVESVIKRRGDLMRESKGNLKAPKNIAEIKPELDALDGATLVNEAEDLLERIKALG
jgi:tetratricopeptide (TPR) repeat protein